MSEIEIKYGLLADSKSSVEEKISRIIEIVESIDKICQGLNDGETWEGIVASKFQETTGRLYQSAANRVLNFKNTNEYKTIVSNSFKDAESTSISTYM